MQLDPTAKGGRSAAHHRRYDRLGTNAEALRLARDGQRGPLGVTAKSQTWRGGRRGRAWVSEPGNLYASLLLTDAGAAGTVCRIVFVAALALHDAIRGGASRGLADRLVLKWPNDLLIDRNKVAGILVEGRGRSCHRVGRQLRPSPGRHRIPRDRSRYGWSPRFPETPFEPLSAAMLARLARRNRGASFAIVGADWFRARCGLWQVHSREDRRRRPLSGSSTPSTRPDARSFASPMEQCRPCRRATCFWRRGRRWPGRRASSPLRRSAASARSA